MRRSVTSLPHSRTRSSAGALLLVAALLGLSGCRSRQTAKDRQEEVNSQLFRELIEKGSLEPVEDFDPGEEDRFAKLERQYADEQREDADPGGPPQEEVGPDTPVPETDWDLGVFDPSEIPINPYLEFGQRIKVYDDGRIMKPYPLPTGQGRKVLQLLERYGEFEVFRDEEGAGAPPPGSVVLDLQEGWVTETWSEPRDPKLDGGQSVPLGDLLFVTAGPEVLGDVEHFINLFAAHVRQIEIEAKIVEVTTTDALDIGIVPIDAVTPIFGLPNASTFVRQVDFSFPNTAPDTSALFTLGAVQDGVAFNAVLQAVADLENVSIISRPKVAVREGARAEIINTQKIPYVSVDSINNQGGYNATLQFIEVGVQMYVIPRVVGTDTVVLNIDIEASQETGSVVTLSSSGDSDLRDQVSTPVVAVRKARTIVRLEPGQAVILGGLISERSVDRERKVPFLGDIPVLGRLFKATSQRKEQTNVLFFIRPRILQGSDLNRPFE